MRLKIPVSDHGMVFLVTHSHLGAHQALPHWKKRCAPVTQEMPRDLEALCQEPGSNKH